MRYCLIIATFLLPQLTYAVTITEVAWMGSEVSANHEWIELYNGGGPDVSLEGWTLTDGMNLTISLSGTLAAGAYGVLERTSDDTAPGTAFLIYTGALVNTGATLVLRNADGQIMDQVAGGENWQNIGGDNTTKETAQYTTGGWVTAIATPGRANETIRVPVTTEPTPTTSGSSATKTTTAASGQKNSSTITLDRAPQSELKLSIALPSHVYVNEPLDFTVTPSGVGPTIASSLRYTWNFGDANAVRGERVTHAYAYPGTYLVQVRAEYASRVAMTEHTVTVLPVTLSLTRNEAGDVQLHNDAPYPVDLSRYTLVGHESLVIPQYTVLLPRSTITIPWQRVEQAARQSLVLLKDALGNVVGYTPLTIRAIAAEPEPLAVQQLKAPVSVPLTLTPTTEPLVLAPQTSEVASVLGGEAAVASEGEGVPGAAGLPAAPGTPTP
jgi:hypothetical protein